MTYNLFDNAKFGDMFLTTEKKQAVFLRFSENAENKFAVLYVKDWGTVQVFRHNGDEVNGDTAHSIIKKQEEPVSEDLEEAAEEWDESLYRSDAFKAGAKWKEKQMMKDAIECKVDWYDGFLLDYTQEQQDYVLEKIGAKVGDKIKVIIIKSE